MTERRRPSSGKRVRMPLSEEKRRSIKFSGREPGEEENKPKLTPRPTPRADRGSNDDYPRPRRSSGRDERKGDEFPRPVRSGGRGERKSDEYPKPRRSFGRDERKNDEFPRPVRSGGRSERKSDEYPKPRRSFGRDERKSDDFPRPRRTEGRGERKSDEYPKPRRSFGRDERKSDDFPRPRRTEGRSERKSDEYPKPRRSFGRDERKSDDFPRPRRNPDRDESPIARKEYTITRRGEKRADRDESPRPYRSEGRNKARSEEFRPKRNEGTRERGGTGKKDSKDLIRLNKYISNAGICSRREADVLIASGAVMVNGKPVTEMGFKVSRTDKVQYGDQTLNTEKLQYVLLNKPKGFITTTDDPENRKTVMALVENACKERIYPVGRLDRNTTGLLLFTNDGEIAKKLSHPKYGIRKIYHVVVDKNVTKTDMKKIGEGMDLEDGPVQVDAIEYIQDANDKKEIGIELHSGQNRVVRRIFESLGYKVEKLDRVAYAGLTKKNLPRGEWRFLSQMEINMLKMIH